MNHAPKTTISGFETIPAGALLSQIVSETSAYGYAHERSVGYNKDWHSHNRLNLAFPRGSSVVRFTGRAGPELQIDRNHVMIMKVGVSHRQWSETQIWDNFALLPADDLIRELSGETLLRSLPELCVKPRSRLLSEVIEKLFHDAVVRRLPESELRPAYLFALKLVLESISASAEAPQEDGAPPRDELFQRILIQIENHLFEDLDPAHLATITGSSRASIYRSFKDATGQSLMGYVRRRRMEEARLLIQAGTHNVSEVALLVGYSDLYSFSSAYKKVFGSAPSHDRRPPLSTEASRPVSTPETSD